MFFEPLSQPTDGGVHLLTMDEVLRARGFVRVGRTSDYVRQDGLTLHTDGQWHVLTESARAEGRLVAGLPGALSQADARQPGLWKWVHHANDIHRRFEIPSWTIAALNPLGQQEPEAYDVSGPVSWATVLDWALATRTGGVPTGWTAPPVELVSAWLPRNALTIQARGHVRQAELTLTPTRWALRAPILSEVAAELSSARHAALADLLADAHARWAMARVGLMSREDKSDGKAIAAAEVDFTGAPPCELLFSAGLDVLRHVVAWLVETAEVLGDPAVTITGLDLARDGNNTTNPNERRQP